MDFDLPSNLCWQYWDASFILGDQVAVDACFTKENTVVNWRGRLQKRSVQVGESVETAVWLAAVDWS